MHKQQIKFSWILARIVFISILVLVWMSEIEWNFFSVLSRSLRLSVINSHLDVRDWIGEILILVLRMKKCFSLCLVDCPTRWSLWYLYLDVYTQITKKYSTAMCYTMLCLDREPDTERESLNDSESKSIYLIHEYGSIERYPSIQIYDKTDIILSLGIH